MDGGLALGQCRQEMFKFVVYIRGSFDDDAAGPDADDFEIFGVDFLVDSDQHSGNWADVAQYLTAFGG